MSRLGQVSLLCSTYVLLGDGLHLAYDRNRLHDAPPDFDLMCPSNGAPAGMQISEASLAYSNLAGYGPDELRADVARGMLLKNVFPRQPGIDMLIRVEGPYYPSDPQRNRVHGEFFGINLGPGSSTKLKVTFQDKDRNVMAPNFILTVASLDELPLGRGGKQSVNVSGATAYAHARNSRIQTTDGSAWAIFDTKAVAPLTATKPRHALFMDEEVRTKSVAFYFEEAWGFEMTLKTAPGAEGRTFWFAGSSSLVCDEMAPCSEFQCPKSFERLDNADAMYCTGDVCTAEDVKQCCQAEMTEAGRLAMTVVHSNLGGQGPDFDAPKSILYKNVFPSSEQTVFLNVTAKNNYTANDSSKSKPMGEFGEVSLKAGNHVELQFDLLDGLGKARAAEHPFWFTFYDIDQEAYGGGQELVRIAGYETYHLSDHTTLVVERDEAGGTSFSASAYGPEDDNPHNHSLLKETDFAKMVSIKYPAGLSSFTVALAASPGLGVRTFQFAGNPVTAYPRNATCGTMTCPVGSSPTPGAESKFCGGSACSIRDAATCCQLASKNSNANCSTFSCPRFMVPKDEAYLIECAGSACVELDTATCCDVDRREYCSPESALVLSEFEIVYSGNKDEIKEIRYYNVFPDRPGQTFDMVVKLTGDRFDVCHHRSGTYGSFGRIHVKRSANVTLDVRIQDRSTNATPTSMSPFLFSLVDFGISPLPGGHSSIELTKGFADGSPILARKSRLTFKGNTIVANSPDTTPTVAHPLSLERRHLRSTATFLMSQSRFKMMLAIKEPMLTGIPLLFSGGTNLVCPFKASCAAMACPLGYVLREDAETRVCSSSTCEAADEPTCCRCAESSALKFNPKSVVASNLGGMGPDVGTPRMLLADVFPGLPKTIDLEITSTTPYFPANAQKNGMEGELLALNMRSGSAVDLNFSFIDRQAGQPFKAAPFFFTVFDLDMQADGGAQESVSVDHQLWHKLAEGGTVIEENGIFKGTAHGTRFDNPNSSLAQNDTLISRSISFLMNSTTSFTVRLNVSSGWSGRNVFFAGNSVLTCERRALCSSHTCPLRWALRATAKRSMCRGDACLRGIDDKECCTKPSTLKVSLARRQ